MQPEWQGSIFTSINPLTNTERLALWILKRQAVPIWFNYWKRNYGQ